MNICKRANLDFKVLVQSLAIIFLITTEISADSNTPKKPTSAQPNPKNSAVAPTKNRPPISEGPKPSKPIPAKEKPNNPPVSTPEVVKPTPLPVPAKPANPPASIPEVVKPTPTPVPLRRPIVSDRKPLPPTGATKAPIQEPPPRYTTFVESNNRRNIPNNQTNYHQQTVRDFYEHTRKYPQPISRNQGYNNNFNTYSWVNNNRYFYGYNYRNYNYITCYDRFNNRFSFITVPNENLTYPVVIQPYPPVMIQPYPVNYYQAFDTTGFLSPILMLLRITQGNYTW